MARTITLQGEEYEVIPSEVVGATNSIVALKQFLGNPQDPYSKQGEKLMNHLIAVWQDLYPREAREWYAVRKEYKDSEMSIKEQVKHQTGRSLASIPTPIYMMMKKVFPEFRMHNRDDFIKFVNKYPIFRMANKV